jgi:hypothetical protein
MLLWIVVNDQKVKNYFLYYLKENVLIFDISNYIDELSVHVVDFVYDWDLLKDGLVNCSNVLIKELIQTKLQLELNNFLKIAKENNCKILSFLFISSEKKEWHSFFSDPSKVIKICKKICKKNLPNYKELKTEKKLFLNKKGKFLDIPCLIPSGDDEEFLLKVLDKLKTINK